MGRIRYTAVVAGRLRGDLASEVNIDPTTSAHADLIKRVDSLVGLLSATIARPEIEIDGQPATPPRSIGELWLDGERRSLLVLFRGQEASAGQVELQCGGLPSGQRRLIDSILLTVTSLAWANLRELCSIPQPAPRPRVFISYRKSHESFAEPLAQRLGREGYEPWFDAWELHAGDSLPGRIEEGLAQSVAFIAVLTPDYVEGRWATEELQSAVHRRVETGFPIIPVLLEECEKPELIRHLVHVDFTTHDPDTFEFKCAEIIDGINRLDRNPFRST